MAFIDGKGLSQASSTGRGQGTIKFGASGLSQSLSTPLAKGSTLYGASGLSQSVATPLGYLVKLVKVTSALELTANLVRVSFDRVMKKNASLLAVANYTLIPVTSGAAVPVVTKVTPEDVENPTYVDLTSSEHTDSANYKAEVSTTGPVDLEGTYVDPAADSGTYTGIGDAPLIKYVEAIGENRVNVVFDERMAGGSDILDPASYSFDKGLSVISVLELDEDTVKLVTSDQTPEELYTLTVT